MVVWYSETEELGLAVLFWLMGGGIVRHNREHLSLSINTDNHLSMSTVNCWHSLEWSASHFQAYFCFGDLPYKQVALFFSSRRGDGLAWRFAASHLHLVSLALSHLPTTPKAQHGVVWLIVYITPKTGMAHPDKPGNFFQTLCFSYGNRFLTKPAAVKQMRMPITIVSQ